MKRRTEKIENINETKIGSSRKSKKIDKPLARWTKKNRLYH